MTTVQNDVRQNVSEKREWKSKPFRELDIMDDYMFDLVTQDLDSCQYIIELSLNIRIRKIRWKEGQKVVHNLPGKRGIRLDFYVEDMEGNLFDVEMQKRNVGNLPKRTRYYKALQDAPLLKSGEVGFDKLPALYTILICGFDVFGHGKYRYTFANTCKEIPGLELGDGVQTIFLNTRGRNDAEVEPELPAFLKFVESSTEEQAMIFEEARIRHLYRTVERLKNHAELEVDYMKMEERERLMRQEAEERGEKRGEERGRKQGERELLKRMIQIKWAKGKSVEQIAEEVEQGQEIVQGILDEIAQE